MRVSVSSSAKEHRLLCTGTRAIWIQTDSCGRLWRLRQRGNLAGTSGSSGIWRPWTYAARASRFFLPCFAPVRNGPDRAWCCCEMALTNDAHVRQGDGSYLHMHRIQLLKADKERRSVTLRG